MQACGLELMETSLQFRISEKLCTHYVEQISRRLQYVACIYDALQCAV